MAGVLSIPLALSPVLAVDAVPETPFGQSPFSDVQPSAWYYEYVQRAYDTGIINGTGPNIFEPERNLLYSESVKMAARMNQKAQGNITLTDGDPWYQPYVDYAKTKAIISKDYDWNATATRAGYVEIFANALPDSDYSVINNIEDGDIPDVATNHPQADAIYKLYRAGILDGVDSTHAFKPEATITRAEIVTIVARMMDPEIRTVFNPVTDYGNPDDQTSTPTSVRLPSIDDTFIFSSGAGGWATFLTLHEDGSFEGRYYDSNLGTTGADYPNGSVSICTFIGQFDQIQKIDEHTYSLHLASLDALEDKDQWIEDGYLYIAEPPYGLESGEDFYLYLPGTVIADLDEDFVSWNMGWDVTMPETMTEYGLFNVNGGTDGGYGFFTHDSF